MSNRLAVVIAATLVALLVALPARAVEVDAEADKLLRAMSEHLKSLDTAAFTATLTIERITGGAGGAGGQALKSQRAFRFTIDRPDRLAITPAGDAPASASGGSLAVSGGKVTAYLPAKGRYVEHDAPATLDETLDSPETAVVTGDVSRMAGQLLKADPYAAITAGATAIRDGGEAKVGDGPGIAARRVRIESPGGAIEWFIATNDKPLPLRIAPDLSPRVDRAKAAGQTVGLSITLDVSEFDAAPKLDDAAFAIAAPEGVMKVASVFDGPKAARPGDAEGLVGKEAPDFTLDAAAGGQVTLSKLKGKVVILDFWATWCGPCRRGLPIVTQVAEEHADKGVVFYAVNLREDKAKVDAFLQQTGLPLQVLMDTTGEVAGQYGVQGIPMTVIIDRLGRVAKVEVGLQPKETLEHALEDVLKQPQAN